MKQAVIGIGTNIGDRLGYLEHAVAALSLLPNTKVTAVSSVYATDPVGYTDQARFLNAAVTVETALSPAALLGGCLGIEAGIGRVRLFKNGPRCIDLDLLLYEGETAQTEELTLPHPRMGERAFVLVPLAELFPDRKPLGFDFAEAIRTVGTAGVDKTDFIIRTEDV